MSWSGRNIMPFMARYQMCQPEDWPMVRLALAFWFFIAFPFTMNFNAFYSGWFYLPVSLSAIACICTHPERLQAGWRHPLGKAMALLLAYTVLHAFVLTEAWYGTTDTLRHSLSTSMFLVVTFYVMQMPLAFTLTMFRWMLLVVVVMGVASIAWHGMVIGWHERLAPLGNHDHAILGANVYCVFTLAGLMLFHPDYPSKRRGRLLAVLAVIVTCVLILLTQSRGPLVSFLLCIMVAFWLTRRFYCFWGFMLLGGLLCADLLLYSTMQANWLPLESFYAPAQHLFERESHRLNIWRLAVGLISQRPWFGHGMQAGFPYGFGGVNPHNLFLGAWYYTGVAAFIMLSAIVVMMVWIGWKRRHSVGGALALLLACHAVCACFTDQGQYVQSPAPLWNIFWLPVALTLALAIQRLPERDVLTTIE